MTKTENKGRKFCFTRKEVRPNEVIEVLVITRQPEKNAWDHVTEVFSALKADNRMKITHWLDNIVLDGNQKNYEVTNRELTATDYKPARLGMISLTFTDKEGNRHVITKSVKDI